MHLICQHASSGPTNPLTNPRKKSQLRRRKEKKKRDTERGKKAKMVEDLTNRGVDSIGVYDDTSSELPDTSHCSKCLEAHQAYAPCTPSKSLPLDAVSPPPRSIKSGITGALSLHDYRKYLSQSAEPVDDLVDRSEKTLKRKTANSNLNCPPALTSLPSSAVSVCSVASTPPPLSPSYSHSVISQRSEQEPEVSEPATGMLPHFNFMQDAKH